MTYKPTFRLRTAKSPRGTTQSAEMGHWSAEFNRQLYGYFPGLQLRVLDLGCKGGGFVRSVLADDHIAMGVEPDAVYANARLYDWAVIPANLFTADLKEHFFIYEMDRGGYGMERYRFDVVTAWDILDELGEPGAFYQNVLNHLEPDGLFIASYHEPPRVAGLVPATTTFTDYPSNLSLGVWRCS